MADTLSLVVKATSGPDAAGFARERGVAVRWVAGTRTDRPEYVVVGDVPTRSTIQHDWFAEATGLEPPFPMGSLLIWSRVDLTDHEREHYPAARL